MPVHLTPPRTQQLRASSCPNGRSVHPRVPPSLALLLGMLWRVAAEQARDAVPGRGRDHRRRRQRLPVRAAVLRARRRHEEAQQVSFCGCTPHPPVQLPATTMSSGCLLRSGCMRCRRQHTICPVRKIRVRLSCPQRAEEEWNKRMALCFLKAILVDDGLQQCVIFGSRSNR